MLNTTESLIPSEDMVTYKFKVPGLADLFEMFSPRQSHIALEGALNVIFGRTSAALPVGAQVDGDESEAAPSVEDDALDHETQIVQDVTYALYAHQKTEDGLGVVPDDYENDLEYQMLETSFRTIFTKLSNDLTADKFNQDVITLHGEMEFFKRIELFSYNYNVEHELLSVTVATTK